MVSTALGIHKHVSVANRSKENRRGAVAEPRLDRVATTRLCKNLLTQHCPIIVSLWNKHGAWERSEEPHGL